MTKPIVLLAEDEITHRRLFERNLMRSDLDIELVVASNGQQAVDYLQSYLAEGAVQTLVLVLDLNMPVLTGIEVLEWMKEDHILKEVPVIILTTSDEPYEVNRCQELGIDSYLVKPVKPGDLEHHISDLL